MANVVPNKSLIRRGDPETISALTDPELHDLLILAKMKRWHTGVTQIEIEKKKRVLRLLAISRFQRLH